MLIFNITISINPFFNLDINSVVSPVIIWISILGYKEWNSSRKGSKNSFVKVVLIPIFIHPVSKLIRLVNFF